MSKVNYSIALRCIGQELERRGLKTFAIKRDGSHFVVLSNDPKTSAAAQVIVRYTLADVEIMDRCGETRRGNQASQEFFDRAQMLRAIGDYLDKYDSALTSITCNDLEHKDSPFRVEYITREGERLIDDRPGAAIFDECILMFQKRSPMAGPPSRTARSQH